MKTIKKIDPMSLAKIYAITTAISGFIVGLIVAASSGMAGMVPGMENVGLMAGLGLISIVALPVLYGIMGFIVGLIGAFIYNIVAGYVGGVKIELE